MQKRAENYPQSSSSFKENFQPTSPQNLVNQNSLESLSNNFKNIRRRSSQALKMLSKRKFKNILNKKKKAAQV
jgi:hypothetical protein